MHRSRRSGTSIRILLPCYLAASVAAYGQVTLSGSPGTNLFPGDSAILEIQEPRQDLPCNVAPVKPVLGFDLKFHGGYEVSIPLKELAGSENLLTMIFRVAPGDRREDAQYFVQRLKVPEISEDASGNAYLEGAFNVGEGKYHVDWLMRDRSERFCSSYWDTEAELAPKDKQLVLPIAAGSVQAADGEEFKEEPPVERPSGDPLLNVKLLINFAPQDANASTLQPVDTAALISILRTLAREPRIGKFSLVAFNLQEQKVLYRQADANRIDFPALGEALHALNLGTVDLKRLAQKNGETDFLTNLIQKELGPEERPDALIFAGPKAMLEENVPTDTLKGVGELEFPVFYMNYNLRPQSVPWRDAIGRAVKFFKGYEFTITRPRDLWAAVSEIVSKSLRFRSTRHSAGAASQ